VNRLTSPSATTFRVTPRVSACRHRGPAPGLPGVDVEAAMTGV